MLIICRYHAGDTKRLQELEVQLHGSCSVPSGFAFISLPGELVTDCRKQQGSTSTHLSDSNNPSYKLPAYLLSQWTVLPTCRPTCAIAGVLPFSWYCACMLAGDLTMLCCCCLQLCRQHSRSSSPAVPLVCQASRSCPMFPAMALSLDLIYSGQQQRSQPLATSCLALHLQQKQTRWKHDSAIQ